MPGTDARFAGSFLKTLDRTQRHILMLYYAEQLSPAEVGLVLRLPESTVRRAIRELRARAQAALAAQPVA